MTSLYSMEVILFILLIRKVTQGKPSANLLKKVFFPRTVHKLGFARRLDIVWDRYNPISIKESTRDKRGHICWQHVTGSAKVLREWQTFLKNADNKKELFTYLSSMLPDRKELYITENDCVKHMGEGTPMGQCNHEEADTLILVPLLHALQTKSIGIIHTGDIDIVVILLANHQQIISANPAADIWIYFHAGKSKRIINLNSIAANLGEETCKSLALFHTLTGSDSTSAFKFKGKRSCWNILTKFNLFPFIQEFAKITDAPYCVSPSLRAAVANYVCKLYRGEVNQHNVDRLRMGIFIHKMRDVDRLPPTSDALH